MPISICLSVVLWIFLVPICTAPGTTPVCFSDTSVETLGRLNSETNYRRWYGIKL